MPRLTTQENLNNYRASSLWYRDGSFLKLRNLLVAYTFPKSQTRFADLKVFVQGTNLFSLDNLHFADIKEFYKLCNLKLRRSDLRNLALASLLSREYNKLSVPSLI